MSTPGAVLRPSTSTISPSGLTWRDSHVSSLTTTLSPRAGAFGNGPARRHLHVDVVHHPRIVRHDVEEVPRLLQRADDRVVRALENADDAALRACAAAFRMGVALVARDASHHAIAVHRGAGVLGRDKQVLLARLFRG